MELKDCSKVKPKTARRFSLVCILFLVVLIFSSIGKALMDRRPIGQWERSQLIIIRPDNIVRREIMHFLVDDIEFESVIGAEYGIIIV